MKKIIISDFDDTIYIHGKINPEIVSLVHQFREDGNLFIIASGSSYPSLIDKISGSNLEYDYLICDHGCNIVKDNNLIFSEVIDQDIVEELITYYKLKNNNKAYAISKDIGVVSLEHPDISKINIPFNQKGDDFKAKEYLTKKYTDRINCYCIMHNNTIEIISGRASKLKAIDKILEIENINSDMIYTIGDGYSDIEMVTKYRGYCVENAVTDLKKVSQKVYSDFSSFISDIISDKII